MFCYSDCTKLLANNYFKIKKSLLNIGTKLIIVVSFLYKKNIPLFYTEKRRAITTSNSLIIFLKFESNNY